MTDPTSPGFASAPPPGGAGPGSPPGAPAGAPAVIKPSVTWYWVGGLTIAFGTIAAIVWFVVSVVTLASIPDTYARIDVPGERTVRLEAGTNTLFTEVDRYASYSYQLPEPPEVTITGTDGTELTVVAERRGSASTSRGSRADSTYTRNGRDGASFATVSVPASGLYTVEVERQPTRDSTSSSPYDDLEVLQIAIGETVDGAAVFGIFGSMGVGFVTFVVGTIILIVVGVKRGGAKRRLRPRPAGPPYGGPRPAYAGYGPPGYGPPGYGPPGYGPPGYGPAGYGPPPGSGPPGYGPPPGYAPGPYGPPPGYGPGPSGPPGWGPPPGPGPAGPYAPPGTAAPGPSGAPAAPTPGPPPPSVPSAPTSSPPAAAPSASGRPDRGTPPPRSADDGPSPWNPPGSPDPAP